MSEWIPVLGVSIPLVAVFGRTVVQPMLTFLERRQGAVQQLQTMRERIAYLEQNLEGIETSVARLAGEQEFRRQLEAPQ